MTVDYATADGTAGAGDYNPAHRHADVRAGRAQPRRDGQRRGRHHVRGGRVLLRELEQRLGATILDGQGVGTIVNDDDVTAAGGTRSEIIHGTRVQKALTPVGTAAGADFYASPTQAFTSYEVVVDATSGDLGTAGPELTRVASDGTTVLQSSQPGRHRLEPLAPVDEHGRRATSTFACRARPARRTAARTTSTACVPTRRRISIPRFNNSGTQVTVLLLQNPTDEPITGNIYFWNSAGTQLHARP